MIITGAVTAVVVVVVLAALGYYFLQVNPINKSDGTANTKATLRELSKLMLVPSDVEPVISTITDTETIPKQPFFKYARNGDIVIIFQSELKAVLYRPSTKRIVNMALIAPTEPISVSGPPPTTATTTAATTTAPSLPNTSPAQ